MSLTERLFGRSSGVEFDLAAVRDRLCEAVRRAAPDAELTRARFADCCRDCGLTPVTPDEFDAAVSRLDGEGNRRFALLGSVLDLAPLRKPLSRLAAGRSAQSLLAALAGLARETPLLTIEVLGQSEPRVEELARRLVAALGASVAGESAEESKKRLHRLDYARLLAEAEEAKQAAAERTERLKKLQDEQEEKRARRGKW